MIKNNRKSRFYSIQLDHDLFEYAKTLKEQGLNFSGLVRNLLREHQRKNEGGGNEKIPHN